MRTEQLTESQTATLPLTAAEGAALQKAGMRLASDRAWWGEAEPPPDRTVIRCTPHGGGLWDVRVVDAIGMISVGSLQLVVRPKIPLDHLLFLLGWSGKFPRLDPQRAAMAAGTSFWTAVAHWFVLATEQLLRFELARDYHELSAALPYAVGALDPVATARSYYAGRLEFTGRFDEFGFDSPLNRVIRAAARIVARSATQSEEIRQRARRIVGRIDDVGDLQDADLRAKPDRRTSRYADAFALGVHVVRSLGRTLGEGDRATSTFLVRTPDLIEEAIRRILQAALGPDRIRREARRLLPNGFSVNPDLVVDNGAAIADVKYKLAHDTWRRQDLYEVVAFAAAFRTRLAAVVDFRDEVVPELPRVPLGDIVVRQLSWPASAQLAPEDAARNLCEDFIAWVSSGDQPALNSAVVR